MSETILVIGGCRSGKSSHALTLAEAHKGDRNLFVATCVPYDSEMQKRVDDHKAERDGTWTGLEEATRIAAVIERESEGADVILVDCLTLWVTNMLMEERTDDAVFAAVAELIRAMEDAACPVIFVSNEVGAGIVPENRLARRFRDLAGFTNRKIAEAAGSVVWMVAGIPVPVKQQEQPV